MPADIASAIVGVVMRVAPRPEPDGEGRTERSELPQGSSVVPSMTTAISDPRAGRSERAELSCALMGMMTEGMLLMVASMVPRLRLSRAEDDHETHGHEEDE